MNDLALADRAAEWRQLKALVLDSVSSPITRRVYNLSLDEFFDWYGQEPRPGFNKATVNAWRAALEARGLESVSINVRITAVRKLAVEAADNGLLAPELASGIAPIKGAKSKGVRVGNWLSLRQSQVLLNTPDVSTKKGATGSRHAGAVAWMRVTSVGSRSTHPRAHSAAGQSMVRCGSGREARAGADDSDAHVSEVGD